MPYTYLLIKVYIHLRHGVGQHQHNFNLHGGCTHTGNQVILRAYCRPLHTTAVAKLSKLNFNSNITSPDRWCNWFFPQFPALLLHLSPCFIFSFFFPMVVDGGYSLWSPFSKCSRECGTGTRTRVRTCTNPAPVLDGQNCSRLGESSQTFKCNMLPCPSECLSDHTNLTQ